MAIHKSDLIKAKDSRDVSDKSLSGEKTGARVLYATADFEFGYPYTGLNDVIELADIPAGATVIPQLSYVACHYFGYPITMQLGDFEKEGRHGVAGSSQADGAGKISTAAPSQGFFGSGADKPAPYKKETRVRAKVIAPFTRPEDKSKLTFSIAYRVQG